jgi:hypothetical protein
VEEEKKKRCCANCEFYEEDTFGDKICTDYDGLYFQWKMNPDERCPEYIESKKTKESLINQ